jgi:predicted transport protein
MPQNENLSAEWKNALGDDWKQVHETWLHTLGNLTLTGYNSEYSDRTFIEKRDMKGGFKESPLRLNKELGQLEQWNQGTIIDRGRRLSVFATSIWSAPNLDVDMLDAYRSQPDSKTSYTIEDHPHLISNNEMKKLFDAFRKEVLALDPAVSEEFLKLYVAYKAETNFVDVVPQAKRLRLSLNMPFPDIIDPHGICKDVTGLGRWGNGDVEVGLTSLDDLAYVIGLVRQSFERQIGNGDN